MTKRKSMFYIDKQGRMRYMGKKSMTKSADQLLRAPLREEKGRFITKDDRVIFIGGPSGGAGSSSSANPIATGLAYADSLSDVDKKVVRRYTGGDFTYMNRHLRTGYATSQPIKDKIVALDRIISDAPAFGKEIALYRFLGETTPDKLGMKIGESWEDKGFASTSYKTSYGSSQPVQLKIIAPPYQRGLFVTNISGHASEQEVILRPSKYRIISIDQIPSKVRDFDYSIVLEML